jgi:catechol-2,3-dioxygenase
MRVALNRVILYVQDVDRLATFYQQIFGLPVVEEIKGSWSVLDAGLCQLALHRVGKAENSFRRLMSLACPGRHGWFRLAQYRPEC